MANISCFILSRIYECFTSRESYVQKHKHHINCPHVYTFKSWAFIMVMSVSHTNTHMQTLIYKYTVFIYKYTHILITIHPSLLSFYIISFTSSRSGTRSLLSVCWKLADPRRWTTALRFVVYHLLPCPPPLLLSCSTLSPSGVSPRALELSVSSPSTPSSPSAPSRPRSLPLHNRGWWDAAGRSGHLQGRATATTWAEPSRCGPAGVSSAWREERTIFNNQICLLC